MTTAIHKYLHVLFLLLNINLYSPVLYDNLSLIRDRNTMPRKLANLCE